MAHNIKWYYHVNLRSLQWLCELRSAPQGHENYRKIAQKLVRKVCEKFPHFERFFRFVNFEDYGIGRMDQEVKKEKKMAAKVNN